MAAIACHALTQNSTQHQYHVPPCPVYVHLPPLVHRFPLLSLLKIMVQVVLPVSSCCAALVFHLPTDTTCCIYIATSLAYVFHIFMHYNIRTLGR
jgi:hypothetical protein